MLENSIVGLTLFYPLKIKNIVLHCRMEVERKERKNVGRFYCGSLRYRMSTSPLATASFGQA